MSAVPTAPTRTSDTRHQPRLIAAFARAALEAAALAVFVLAVVLWSDALVGR